MKFDDNFCQIYFSNLFALVILLQCCYKNSYIFSMEHWIRMILHFAFEKGSARIKGSGPYTNLINYSFVTIWYVDLF